LEIEKTVRRSFWL